MRIFAAKMRLLKCLWVFNICISITSCLASVSYPVPNDIAVPLETLVEEGEDLYNAKDWSGTINLFEKALINHKMQQHLQTACSAKCKNKNIASEINMDFTDHDDLHYFGDLIAQASCMKLCKEEHPYHAVNLGFPGQDILDDFKIKKPYNYLQYAYYQSNLLKKACQAAQTYFSANLGDEQAQNNLEFYKAIDGINETYFKDLEEPIFAGTFFEGVTAYEAGKHEDAVTKIERSLLQYFPTFDDCHSLCFKPIEREYFHRFHRAVAEQYLTVIDCSAKCDEDLSPVMLGEKIKNFVSRCFSYLQFSYHSLGNWPMAVSSAASVLLLQPEDETAQRNMDFYRSQEGSHGLSLHLHFTPRADAVSYQARLAALQRLREIGESNFGHFDEGEAEEQKEMENELLVSMLADRITEQLNQRIHGELEE